MRSGAAFFQRLGVGVLGVAGSAVMVAGFLKPTASGPSLPPGVVTIQYWEKWGGIEAEAMHGVVKDFNAGPGRRDGIFVEYTSMSQVDQKTLISTAAGLPPDIAGIWDIQLAEFAAMDAVEPLDDLARAHGISAKTYKPVYWNACHYDGKLYGLVSTPGVAALHYSKKKFTEHAADLAAMGESADRAPQTLDELDRYAAALTTYETGNGRRRIASAGYLPLVPGWYIAYTSGWFGGSLFSDGQLRLQTKPVEQAYAWIAGYSRTLGKDAVNDFRSGLGSYASSQGPFLTGAVAMELQGPWNATFIEQFAPQMNRVGVPADELARESAFPQLTLGASSDDICRTLGDASRAAVDGSVTWNAGIYTLTTTFGNKKLTAKSLDLIPALDRRKYTSWAVAPFPSAVPGVRDVAYCPFDALVIPRGSKHKAQAFEFLAYLSRPENMEPLCSAHCKNSPLESVSPNFLKYHPNPYIQVFEDLANSPNAFAVPSMPIWPMVLDELGTVAERCYLLEQSPADALRAAADRLGERWAEFQALHERRLALAAKGRQ